MTNTRKPRKPRAIKSSGRVGVKLGKAVKLEGNMCCPHCGYGADGASCMGHDASPKAGDLAVCICCATVLVYTGDNMMRVAAEYDMAGLDWQAQLHISLAIQAIKAIPPHLRPRKGSIH